MSALKFRVGEIAIYVPPAGSAFSAGEVEVLMAGVRAWIDEDCQGQVCVFDSDYSVRTADGEVFFTQERNLRKRRDGISKAVRAIFSVPVKQGQPA